MIIDSVKVIDSQEKEIPSKLYVDWQGDTFNINLKINEFKFMVDNIKVMDSKNNVLKFTPLMRLDSNNQPEYIFQLDEEVVNGNVTFLAIPPSFSSSSSSTSTTQNNIVSASTSNIVTANKEKRQQEIDQAISDSYEIKENIRQLQEKFFDLEGCKECSSEIPNCEKLRSSYKEEITKEGPGCSTCRKNSIKQKYRAIIHNLFLNKSNA